MPSQTPTDDGAVMLIDGATGFQGFWASAYCATDVNVAPAMFVFRTPPTRYTALSFVAFT